MIATNVSIETIPISLLLKLGITKAKQIIVVRYRQILRIFFQKTPVIVIPHSPNLC